MSTPRRRGATAVRGRVEPAPGRRRSLRRVALAVAALVLAVAVAWVVYASPLLAVGSVRVEGAPEAEHGALLEAAGVPLGTPLARLDTDAVAARVARVPSVRHAAASRSWPSTVVLAVVPRTPLFAVRDSAGRTRLVDAEGVAFREVPTAPRGAPLLAAGRGLADEAALRTAAEVLQALPEPERAEVRDLTVASANLVTFTLGRVDVVWGGPSDGARKVAVLRALLPTKPALVDVSAPDLPVTR